ncbi:phBC6A51 family helix-turn-helix protein [Ammoniphilus sp. CFH 90114]|uniref:phBC6A51 family helix-turn-helix protein n=1 Tax=Ammoniphilus sp. CFH 90114 TaxID=2493665 RepID=UPI00100E1210|nr:phBC6A51 family helix-turn-helix protein [Ammoniphilus sp. CFH 90114]RXT14901.1 hypothetical protein EIZ39_01430 [Ammoniphilus sp. CFH 90114]
MKSEKFLTRQKRPFSSEQLIAIDLLSNPKNSGMTLEEIAQKCNVSRRTLYEWRVSDDYFIEEVKRQATIKAGMHTAEIYDILLQEIRKKPTAKMIEVFLRSQNLLNHDTAVGVQVNVNDRSQEAIEAEIERITLELEEADRNYERAQRRQDKKTVIDVDLGDEDDE